MTDRFLDIPPPADRSAQPGLDPIPCHIMQTTTHLRLTILATILAVWLTSRPMPSLAQDADWIGPANNAFAAELYGKLAAGEGNLFFSPNSIETALAMTCAGARGNTATQMD